MIDVDWNPEPKKLREFGGIYLPLFLALLGGWLSWRHGLPAAPIVLWCAAGLIGAVSWIAPPAVRPVYLLLVGLTFPIGWTISHVVMALIYYGILTPIGLLLRLFGRDPLTRRFDPQAQSYWTPHCPPVDPRRYFRQY